MSKAYVCPNCGSEMEVLGFSASHFRVCPACKELQWDQDGRTETRYPVLKPPDDQIQ